MITLKNARYPLIALLLSIISAKINAQNIDEKTYKHKMLLMDSLSLYKMNAFDTLSHVSILKKVHNKNYPEDCYGWIEEQNREQILFLSIYGKEIQIEKKELTGIKPLPLIPKTIDTLINRDRKRMDFVFEANFAKNYELILWLHKKGKDNYSKQLLPERLTFFGDTDVRNGFGALYYDAMLSAYSNRRNYAKAIVFGEHLSASAFKGYEYQKEAIALTRQLKNEPEDFKTFRLPDSLEWDALKQKLNRSEQIIYLADRLRLLNCIQPGQPAGISYDMFQYSISSAEAGKLQVSYWEPNAKYQVVNPFFELYTMKLNLQECELLLPYLLIDTFIPSYNYHRDFFPERNLHKLSWVVETLIYDTTNKLFFDRFAFDSLTIERKKIAIANIKKWCDNNAALSPEALTIKELKTAVTWTDFYKALRTARSQKIDSLLSAVVQRFYDFPGNAWPSHRALMAQTMYDLGSEKYIDVVKKWNKDTTDKWTSLWTSMFLIKYDKSSYEPAMNQLATILKQCDGTTYYPNAMNLLLSLNDKRAFKLAEGIVDKSGFQSFIYWDYYVNFLRELLAGKSDYTFKFLTAKLDGYTPDEMKNVHKDQDNVLTQRDTFVLAVDELKSDTPGYYSVKTNMGREQYIKELDKWFKAQYALQKEGKPNELHLKVKQVPAPVSFVDSYSR